MPKYTVTERSFIDNRIVEPGEVVDYEGHTHGNLAAVDKDATKAKETASEADINKLNLKRQGAAATGVEAADYPK